MKLITDVKQLQVEYAHLRLDKKSFEKSHEYLTNNVFTTKDRDDIENPDKHLLRIMRRPENFYFTCKHLFGIELLPIQTVIMSELWQRKFPMLVGSRGLSKSFTLSLYAMLRAIINQGSKVVVVGAGLRQSKHLFNYCERFWYSSPVLRSLFNGYEGKESGPKTSNDRFMFGLGDSTIVFLPIGTGEKIRGERATHLILDEFACVDKNTIVETEVGLKRIIDCQDIQDRMFNKYGELESPTAYNITPKTDVYEIKTTCGISFKCSKIHMCETRHGWKMARELQAGDQVCCKNNYKWPEKSCWENKNLLKLFGKFFTNFAEVTPGLISIKGKRHRKKTNNDNTIDLLKEENLAYTEMADGTLLIQNVFDLNNNDKLPNNILSCSKEDFSIFLKSFFDEVAIVKEEEKRSHIAFQIDNPQLRLDFQVLLLKMDCYFYKAENEIRIDVAANSEFAKTFGFKSKFIDGRKRPTINKVEFLTVESVVKLDYLDNLYDFYLPETNSFYGNGIVQHNTIPPDIYENVIAGFAAVSANPVESAKQAAKKEMYEEFGMAEELSKIIEVMGNQTVLCGTAYYEFNHFAKYWKRYKQIIESRGQPHLLASLFEDGRVPAGFNHKDFSIIRIPYDVLPKAFMDEGQIARSKANVHSGIFSMEFGAIFCKDSEGFFKRSLIESCVANKTITNVNGFRVEPFDASLFGNPKSEYIYGIDPAAERDNFAIVVLEVSPEVRKIVYVWTVNKREFHKKLADGVSKKDDYYGYCARKVRELMKVFPTNCIAIDSQGGGGALSEALHDSDKMEDGEQKLWPTINKDKPRFEDNQKGLHILEMIQFADAQWVSDANHGMKKDFEDAVLLFPQFNTANIAEAIAMDAMGKNKYDTVEDCLYEIEELKDELATIIHSQTGVSGRDRWDTPEVKESGGKKGRLRKDRYSALLMANMMARTFSRKMEADVSPYSLSGGFVSDFADMDTEEDNKMPKWIDTGWDDSVIIV